MIRETAAFHGGRLALALAATALLAGCTTGDPTAALTSSYAPAPSSSRASETAQELGSVEFLPVVGVPAEKVESLARALGETAAARGIAIGPAGRGGEQHIRLKGYFSAVADGSSAGIVYVFDILDENGTLVDRIQGQERVAAASSDPWAGAGEATFRAIAAATLDRFAERLAARR